MKHFGIVSSSLLGVFVNIRQIQQGPSTAWEARGRSSGGASDFLRQSDRGAAVRPAPPPASTLGADATSSVISNGTVVPSVAPGSSDARDSHQRQDRPGSGSRVDSLVASRPGSREAPQQLPPSSVIREGFGAGATGLSLSSGGGTASSTPGMGVSSITGAGYTSGASREQPRSAMDLGHAGARHSAPRSAMDPFPRESSARTSAEDVSRQQLRYAFNSSGEGNDSTRSESGSVRDRMGGSGPVRMQADFGGADSRPTGPFFESGHQRGFASGAGGHGSSRDSERSLGIGLFSLGVCGDVDRFVVSTRSIRITTVAAFIRQCAFSGGSQRIEKDSFRSRTGFEEKPYLEKDILNSFIGFLG